MSVTIGPNCWIIFSNVYTFRPMLRWDSENLFIKTKAVYYFKCWEDLQLLRFVAAQKIIQSFLASANATKICVASRFKSAQQITKICVDSEYHKYLRRFRMPQRYTSAQNTTHICVGSEYHIYLRRIRISHIFASFQITKKIYVDLQSQRFVSSQLRQLRLQWRFASAQNTINVYVSSEFSKGLRQLSVP